LDYAREKGGVMADEQERRNTFDKYEELRQKAAELQQRIDAMGPDERAAFHRSIEGNQPEIEFINEIIVKILDGSMPAAEAELWMAETEREMDARQARRLRSKGE